MDWMALHCETLRYIHHTPADITLCGISVCVCLCLSLCVRARGPANTCSQMKPRWSQRHGRSRVWTQGVKTEEGGRRGKGKGKWGSQFDIINHAEQGVAKQVRRETSRQLCPLSAQIIVKAKPTPTSKLHSVTNLICKQKQALELEHCQKTNIRSRVSIYPVEERKLTQYFS